jgi:hypothetical protein
MVSKLDLHGVGLVERNSGSGKMERAMLGPEGEDRI